MDRRHFLSAAVAATVMAPVAALALPAPEMVSVGHDRAAWDAAMLAFERATADEAWFCDCVYTPAEERATRDGREVNEPIADAMEMASQKVADAIATLMNTPAPDAKALRWKLDYLLVDDGSGYNSAFSNQFRAQTMADMGRLLV